MSTAARPQGKAVYAASQLDESWLLDEQRKLYARSREISSYVFHKLWGLVTDPRNLRSAVARVARNRGHRTSGVDGLTVRGALASGGDAFVAQLRAELRSGAYRPSPVRRVLIPKGGQPGKFRPLGIPTVKDRVVQAAMKNILEPIFEAGFYPTSYGFRPGKSVHGALEHLRLLLRPKTDPKTSIQRLPYQWAIEGDIRGCFDHIDHHRLMERVRQRVRDAKVNRLILAFLKAGILSEGQFLRTDNGTPQGGILSPLLANIALGVIDERYERYVWPARTPTPLTDGAKIHKRATSNREWDKKGGKVVFVPIRYADDFIVLVGAPPGPEQEKRARETAAHERVELAKVLKEGMGLELSESKTLVTPVTERMRFLGHQVRVRRHTKRARLASLIAIPKDRSQRLRELVKAIFRRSSVRMSLREQLKTLNPLLRGWGCFYRYASCAKRVFSLLTYYVWWTIRRWLKKKHQTSSLRALRRYVWRKPGGRSIHWRDGNVRCFEMKTIPVRHFQLGWSRPPAFASTSMESRMRNERRTSGSDGGAQKPAGESR